MPRYRIFCLENEVKNLPEVTIEEQYPAFVVVATSEKVIAEIRKRYPVEKLECPQPLPDKQAVAALATPTADPKKRGPYFRVVRFNAPVRKEWIETLERGDCELCEAIGRFTIVVKCPNKTSLAQLHHLPTQPQITCYVPHVDLGVAQRTDLSPSDITVASFFSAADQRQAKRTLHQQGIYTTVEAGKTDLTIDFMSNKDPGQAIQALVALPGLRSLGVRGLVKPSIHLARKCVAGQVIPSKEEDYFGLTGKGEIVAVADTGLSTGQKETIHPDFKGRVRDITAFSIAEFWRYRVNNPDQNDGAADMYRGHGTLICGCILGNGTRSMALNPKSPPIQGLAPEAELIFQALQHKADWNKLGYDWWKNVKQVKEVDVPPYYLLGIPDNLQDLFQPAYEQGARVHLNCWGEDKPGSYDNNCWSLDQFVWDHKDFLIVVAAGNGGVAVPHPNPLNPDIIEDMIALGSIGSPAVAKNCLTVGATENAQPNPNDDHFSETTYGKHPQKRWSNKPFGKDSMVDDATHIAPLSSRGPTREGRRKPDVVAPGTMLLSIRSSQLAADDFGNLGQELAKYVVEDNSEIEKAYMYAVGTSMSAAVVAGCALLVRQYLREIKGFSNPTAALVKAIIIHSAQYHPYSYAHPYSSASADNEQGWGRVDLQTVLLTPWKSNSSAESVSDLRLQNQSPDQSAPSKPNSSKEPGKDVFFYDNTEGLAEGELHELHLELCNPNIPLRVTMVYTDRLGRKLINNLNLIAFDPKDTPFVGNDFTGSGMPDTVNNVEGIIVNKPKKGRWKIRVVVSDLPQGGVQDFALVITGGGLKEIEKKDPT